MQFEPAFGNWISPEFQKVDHGGVMCTPIQDSARILLFRTLLNDVIPCLYILCISL